MKKLDIALLIVLLALGVYSLVLGWIMTDENSNSTETSVETRIFTPVATSSSCLDSEIHVLNQGLMSLGVILIVVTLAFFVCDHMCDCSFRRKGHILWFLGFTMICGSLMIWLGNTIIKRAQVLNCNSIRNSATQVQYVGVGVLVVSFLGFASILYGRKMIEKSREELLEDKKNAQNILKQAKDELAETKKELASAKRDKSFTEADKNRLQRELEAEQRRVDDAKDAIDRKNQEIEDLQIPINVEIDPRSGRVSRGYSPPRSLSGSSSRHRSRNRSPSLMWSADGDDGDYQSPPNTPSGKMSYIDRERRRRY